MEYSIENQQLLVRVKETGGELCGVFYKETGQELLWQGNPSIWSGQAPILFPYCGRLKDDILVAKSKEYKAFRHGFARKMKFEPAVQEPSRLVMRLASSETTKEFFPYDFVLDIEFSLLKNTILQRVIVKNPGDETLPFTVGFHPAFALPFGGIGETSDYSFVFEQKESPLEIKTPGGFVSGEKTTFFENQDSIPLSDDIFAKDSICLTNLHSKFLTLQKTKGENIGASIKVGIADYPQVLLWGPPKGPLAFTCIEPWHGLPDPENQEYGEFMNKPGLKHLEPGKEFETVLSMEFTI